MTTFGLFDQRFEIDALHAARGTHETTIDNFASQTNGFEYLRALVGLQRRDAHLGHDFQHALANRFIVGIDQAFLGAEGGAEQAIIACLPECFKRQVGVDRVCTVTGQQTVVMHFSGFTSFNDQTDQAALVSAHQMVMHGATGYQGTQRNALRTDLAVRQNNESKTFGNR